MKTSKLGNEIYVMRTNFMYIEEMRLQEEHVRHLETQEVIFSPKMSLFVFLQCLFFNIHEIGSHYINFITKPIFLQKKSHELGSRLEPMVLHSRWGKMFS